jgi:hypothetical protein|tara:strand:+ start:305 stop:628 length:324 start_codon:yes stop_codon:yes gene_type:complete
MEKIFKISIYLSVILIGMSSCQGLKDGLEGNKKSKSSEEFLINKKSPLVMPPDYSKLPLPENNSNQNEKTQDFDLKKVLEKNSNNQKSKTQTNKSFQKSIIEKIKTN